MQNTPDRHPARFSGPAPVRFPGRMRHNKHVTATRPLQRNFAAAFRITPNAGCVPGTGGCPDAVRGGTGRMGRHGKFGEGSDKKAAGRATGTAQEQPGQQKEQRQKQRREQNGNNARPAETAERTTAGTAAGQDRNSGGARREQRRGKTGTAAEATAGRTEEGKLQRKIRSSTYNPEAAFAKNFNNKAAIKSQPNSQIR